jgi:AcrR family transcriptional regulator
MTLTPKAIKKKRYILEKAETVFIREGYPSVTMKHIVEECGISRGGLYKYYSSAQEIFEDILSLSKEDDYAYFTEGMEQGRNAVELLHGFLQKQKEELANAKNTIRAASYEYFLSRRRHLPEEVLGAYFNGAVAVFSRVLAYGIERQEMTRLAHADIEKTARHFVVALEGLNVLAMSMSVSPELIQEQLDLIMAPIV